MRIGIEGYEAMLGRGARGRRARKMLASLAEEYPGHEFYVYTPKAPKLPEAKEISGLFNVRICLPPPSGFGGTLWRLFGITNHLEADKVDLLLGIDGVLPFNLRRSGVEGWVRECAVPWMRYPGMFNPLKRLWLSLLHDRSFLSASKTFVVPKL